MPTKSWAKFFFKTLAVGEPIGSKRHNKGVNYAGVWEEGGPQPPGQTPLGHNPISMPLVG